MLEGYWWRFIGVVLVAITPLSALASFNSYFTIMFETAIPDQNVVEHPRQVRIFFRYMEANGAVAPYREGMRTAFFINRRCMADHSATIAKLGDEFTKMLNRCGRFANGKHPNRKRFHECLTKADEWNKHAAYPCQDTSHQLSTITKSFRAEVRAMWTAWQRVKGVYKRQGIYPY